MPTECVFIGGSLAGEILRVGTFPNWKSPAGETYRRERISVSAEGEYTDVFVMDGWSCMTAIKELIKLYIRGNHDS